MGNDPVPNKALRERVGAVFGSSITQGELAEKVCDWLEGETGKRPGVDYQMMGRYMRGENTWPDKGTRRALRVILGAESDAELGFYIKRNQAATKPRLPVEEDDPVHRRAMLRVSAGTVGSMFQTALLRPAMVPASAVSAKPLKAQLAGALSDYHHARYTQLGKRLPGMMRAAASSPAEWHTRTGIYNLVSEFLLKHGRYELALMAAKEATRCAQDGEDVLLSAQSMLTCAIAMRHLGMGESAHLILADSAGELARAGGLSSIEHLSQYGLMIGACGYTAAGIGDAGAADSYLAESERVAERFEQDVPTSLWSYGPDQHRLYVASAAIALEKPGAALKAVQAVDVRRRPTLERKARYLTDYAQACLLAGRKQPAAEAMRQVLDIAPSEIRTRPTAKRTAQAAGINAL